MDTFAGTYIVAQVPPNTKPQAVRCVPVQGYECAVPTAVWHRLAGYSDDIENARQEVWTMIEKFANEREGLEMRDRYTWADEIAAAFSRLERLAVERHYYESAVAQAYAIRQ